MKALLFPGQGSQAVGMGQDLYATHEGVREAYAEANVVLGYDIAELSFNGPATDLAQTNVTQPALLVNSIAVLRVLAELGVRYDCVIGHSLGEYSALVACGAVPFTQAVGLVRRRGEAMQAAARKNPGAMAAVLGLDDQVVEEICADIKDVWPANFNSPGQVVVSGSLRGLDRLTQKAARAGAKKILRLPVSGAFHSPHMRAAAEDLGPALQNADWAAPRVPFFSVCTVAFENGLAADADGNGSEAGGGADGSRTDSIDAGARPSFAALLREQVTSPVRFTQSVRALIAAGHTEFLEVGPGNVLSGLVRRIAPEASVAGVGDAQTLAALRETDWLKD
jgi:[acyl-carrier-protein] S-malonyltransferase